MAAIDVLIVEDDEGVRESEADVLHSGGYTTAEVGDCLSALELLESEQFGSVVLDVYMSGLSGLWLLDQLDDPPPVLLVTAHDYDPNVLSRREKFFMYLQKPVAPLELLQAVSRALKASQSAPERGTARHRRTSLMVTGSPRPYGQRRGPG